MSAPVYRGLTWDHPRGYNALAAAAVQAEGLSLHWDKHPLEGFESHPIADLCARYDLVVLDHPHVGEAVAADCLVPVEALFAADEIAGWQAAVAGPSLASYEYAGKHWALPLDAATQVMAYRRARVDTPPTAWVELPALSQRRAVALSLAGPHAILSFQSVCGAFGAGRSRELFMDRTIGREAYALMLALTGDATVRAQALNPIAMLGAIERYIKQAIVDKIGTSQLQQLKSSISAYETKILSVEQSMQEKVGSAQVQQLKSFIMNPPPCGVWAVLL